MNHEMSSNFCVLPELPNIPPYSIHEILGRGAYATVYKASDVHGNYVALKTIMLENEAEGVPSTALREISVMQHIQHTNVLRLLDIHSTSKLLAVAFELADLDLKRYMDLCNGPLPPCRVKSFLYQMLQAVAHIHQIMILHRDIKPQNLLLFANGIIKIADFGLSRAFSAPVSGFSHEVVTLWYRSPDVLLGNKSYDTGVDIWSLGCVFAEMLEGKPLFKAENAISLMAQIFEVLGTPTLSDMPGYSSFANWKLITELPFYSKGNLSAVVTHADPQALDLLKRMITYNERERISAQEALFHPYFTSGEPVKLFIYTLQRCLVMAKREWGFLVW